MQNNTDAFQTKTLYMQNPMTLMSISQSIICNNSKMPKKKKNNNIWASFYLIL